MTITLIQLLMTTAMVFYAIAIYLGINQRQYKLSRWVHVSIAFVGFSLDMFATYLMESSIGTDEFTFSSSLLVGHSIVSTTAIVLFGLMFLLGVKRKLNLHKIVVWYAFIPAWVLAYISGIALLS